MKKERDVRVTVFLSLEDENRAEHCGLAHLTPIRRLEGFAILQERMWGTKWTKYRMIKIATFEKLTW